MNDSAQRYLRYLRNLKFAEAAHCLDEASIQADLAASLSPLRHGQVAAKASRRLESRLFRRLVAASLAGDPPPEVPEYEAQDAIPIAKIVGTERLLWRPLLSLTGHSFFPGTTGSGKSTAEVVIAHRLLERSNPTPVTFFAGKEAGRLLLHFSNSILLRPHQLPVNFLEPIGDPRLYFATLVPILARGIGVRSDYVPKFLDVVIRTYTAEKIKGRKLSLAKLVKVFRLLGSRGDKRCATIATALATFNLYLGDTAQIENAPPWEDRFQVIILDRKDAPPAYRACLDGMMQLRFQTQAAQEGYTNCLRRVIFYDEAGLEFGREFESQQIAAGFVSAAKISISQMRSYGMAIIFSDQSYGLATQEIKNNTNNICAFRTFSTEDVRELALRMNLTESHKQRLPNFPSGRAVFAAPDLPAPVEIQFDFIDLGPYPSEAQIAVQVEPLLRDLRQNTTFTPEDPIEPIDIDELLGKEASSPDPVSATDATTTFTGTLLADQWAFLRDVARHADSGIAARFHRLGFGGSKGTRIKEELIALGLLEVLEFQKSGIGAPTKLLRLTALAQTLPDL